MLTGFPRESFSESQNGSRDSSVVRAPDSWLKGLGFESQQEQWDQKNLQGQLSVLTLILVSVPPLCYYSNMWKNHVHSAKLQVAGYSETRMHPMHVALDEVTWYGVWLYVVHRTQRDGSSFEWHPPCKNQTMLQLHHFGGYSRCAVQSYSHLFRVTYGKSAVSLLESGE